MMDIFSTLNWSAIGAILTGIGLLTAFVNYLFNTNSSRREKLRNLCIVLSLVFLLCSGLVVYNAIMSRPLYQTNSSSEWQRWLEGSHSNQWKVNGDALTSDGSDVCCQQDTIVIPSPFQPATNDYAVEAQIQITGINKHQPLAPGQNKQFVFFGLLVRGTAGSIDAYVVHVEGSMNELDNAVINAVGVGSAGFQTIAQRGVGKILGTVVHTYRVEVKGNTLTFQIDGRTIVMATDTNFPEGSIVGLTDSGCQLVVQDFSVYTL